MSNSNELRKKERESLEVALKEKRKELSDIRLLQKKENKNGIEIRKARKEIARIITILREKEILNAE